MVLGSRGLRINILGSWGERSFFFQGAERAKTPLWRPLNCLVKNGYWQINIFSRDAALY